MFRQEKQDACWSLRKGTIKLRFGVNGSPQQSLSLLIFSFPLSAQLACSSVRKVARVSAIRWWSIIFMGFLDCFMGFLDCDCSMSPILLTSVSALNADWRMG